MSPTDSPEMTGDDKAAARCSTELISIVEAARRGVCRLRFPIWSNPLDHIQIDVVDGKPGPWLHLWCPFNTECNGRDPVDVLGFQWANYNSPGFEIYVGPEPTAPEYKSAVAAYTGCLSKSAGRPRAAASSPNTPGVLP